MNTAMFVLIILTALIIYALGSVVSVLKECHKELTRIRLATVSMHDQIIPVVLLKRLNRK